MHFIPGKRLVVTLAFTFLCSCASRGVAPVDSRATEGAYRPAPVSGYAPAPVTSGYHQVARGDTLYSISWRYGLDYRDVARWNNIPAPYVIHPGQRIRLTPQSSVRQSDTPRTATSPSRQSPPSAPAAATTRPSTSATSSRPSSPIVTGSGPINWHWPTTGNVIRSNTPIAQKGVDISGREGQDVSAAADGVVVYSGSGLLGYGKLIIIKHNDTYLSAYAHNQVIQVDEGEMIKAGQKIGTMGRGNKGEPLLHFEIRKDGQPVDPLQYLPARS